MAATAGAHRGVQIASDWLLAHVNDPNLDDAAARNYVVYLCPTEGGELLGQLQTFWDASRTQVGWNGAHNSFPHITLTSAFPCGDGDVDDVVAAVRRVAADFARDFERLPVRLEKYLSPNFLGMFVGKEEESLLRALAQQLTQCLVKLGVADPGELSDPSPTKSYHVTLAYQFLPQHCAALEDLLSASVHPGAKSDWELRLYSFEERMRNQDAFKVSDIILLIYTVDPPIIESLSCVSLFFDFQVVFNHSPREDDELELRIGDLVHVSPEESKASTDGWVLGTSWLTGCRGYLPKNYLQQTAETDAWTLHLGMPMTDLASISLLPTFSSASLERLKNSTGSLNRRNQQQQMDNGGTPARPRSASAISSSGPSGVARRLIKSPASPPLSSARRIYIMRHGERVDFTFGQWVPYCFDEKGTYTQKDLNMPTRVPRRLAGPEGFLLDCPLTKMGLTQAKLVGEGLRRKDITFSHVYCSPSLRCIQTCHNLLLGLGVQHQLKINVEPGLFEWLAWYQNSMPDWMTPEELVAAGYNIQLGYKPYISAEELQDTVRESCEAYYTRNFFVTQCMLQATEEAGGNVMLVGHAATLDVCTRQLTGHTPRPVNEMMSVVRKVPYCSLTVVEEHREVVHVPNHTSTTASNASLASRKTSASQHNHTSVKSTWKMVTPPIPPLTHCNNSRFNWQMLLPGSEQQQQQQDEKSHGKI